MENFDNKKTSLLNDKVSMVALKLQLNWYYGGKFALNSVTGTVVLHAGEQHNLLRNTTFNACSHDFHVCFYFSFFPFSVSGHVVLR